MSKRVALICLLIVSAFGATTARSTTLLDADFLRVSVTCPEIRGEGLLVTVNENRRGDQGKLSALYRGGKLDEIETSESNDGADFSTSYSMSRSLSAQIGGGELDVFLAFEHSTNEVMRFYCLADESTKQLYEETMKFNREMLEKNRP